MALFAVVAARRQCESSTLRRFKQTDFKKTYTRVLQSPRTSLCGYFFIWPMSGRWFCEGPTRTVDTLTRGFRTVSKLY